MYPLSPKERAKLEQRKTHKMLQGFPTGSMADLHEILVKEGFGSQYRAGEPSYSESGLIRYLKKGSGEKAALIRVGKGKPAMWTGAKVGLIRTAQQPDVWQLIRKARRQ